jgi:hypothetical protein
MTKLLNLENRVFGRLTVQHRAPDHITEGGNALVVWRCICSCGKLTNVLSSSLLQDKTKSCGCLLVDSAAEKGKANRKHGGYSTASSYEARVKYQALVNIKERSRRRGYESDLDVRDLPELTSHCPVLGLKYNRGSLKDKNSSPSVDRKNTNLPYLKKYKDNLVFISHRANRIKSDASIDDIRKVLQYLESQGEYNGCRQSH